MWTCSGCIPLLRCARALDGMVVRLAARQTARRLGGPGRAVRRALPEGAGNGDVDRLISLIETFRNRLQTAANNPGPVDLAERIHERIRVVRQRVALLPGAPKPWWPTTGRCWQRWRLGRRRGRTAHGHSEPQQLARRSRNTSATSSSPRPAGAPRWRAGLQPWSALPRRISPPA